MSKRIIYWVISLVVISPVLMLAVTVPIYSIIPPEKLDSKNPLTGDFIIKNYGLFLLSDPTVHTCILRLEEAVGATGRTVLVNVRIGEAYQTDFPLFSGEVSFDLESQRAIGTGSVKHSLEKMHFGIGLEYEYLLWNYFDQRCFEIQYADDEYRWENSSCGSFDLRGCGR